MTALRLLTVKLPSILCSGNSPDNPLGLKSFGCRSQVGSPVSGAYIRSAAHNAAAVFNVEGGDSRVSQSGGESADGSVTLARKASLVLTVAVEGKAAHAGDPTGGASAIDALALKIVRVRVCTGFVQTRAPVAPHHPV